MRKKIMILLSLVLILSLIPTPAYAASDEANAAANALYELGLFNGTGTDANGNPVFALDRAPTRSEAITMLVRLLGQEDQAQSKEWTTPFTDVANWAKPYVGYAYANKLANGTSDTTFGGDKNATVSQYITFVLRALGYDSSADFQWDKAWELSDKLGITNGQYNAGTTNFTRGDAAIISYRALSANLKGTNTTLLEDLTAKGVVKEQHTHNWATRQVAEVGHYESSGTHMVTFKRCDCGFEVNGDMPNATEIWRDHKRGCNNFYLNWREEVPNDPEYVVDTPAHEETYCTVCGAVK